MIKQEIPTIPEQLQAFREHLEQALAGTKKSEDRIRLASRAYELYHGVISGYTAWEVMLEQALRGTPKPKIEVSSLLFLLEGYISPTAMEGLRDARELLEAG